jgi:hypothetical protein
MVVEGSRPGTVVSLHIIIASRLNEVQEQGSFLSSLQNFHFLPFLPSNIS